MEKEDFFAVMRSNPVMHLATLDGDQPRVRAVLLYKGDSDGIVFHTGKMKDLYQQIHKGAKAELCFNDVQKNVQVRVSGVLSEITTPEIQEEILDHPSRGFMKALKAQVPAETFPDMLRVFRLTECKAVWWSFETNFKPKNPIDLCN